MSPSTTAVALPPPLPVWHLRRPHPVPQWQHERPQLQPLPLVLEGNKSQDKIDFELTVGKDLNAVQTNFLHQAHVHALDGMGRELH